MKAAILDTNKKQLNELSDQICSHYFAQFDLFVYKFDNEEEFIDFLFQGIQFDLLFIDDVSTTLLTMKTIQELLPTAPIILLTSSTNYIPLNNLEILQKPYHIKDIDQVLFYHLLYKHPKPKRIKVIDRGAITHISVDDIYYFESYYRHVYVYTASKKYECFENSFYKYVTLLEHFHFIEVHKSILLQCSKIKYATSEEYVLKNEITLYPSSRKKNPAYKKYKQYLNTTSK